MGLLGALAAVVWTFGDYGIPSDEPYYNEYGKYVLAYYTSGLEDRRAFDYLPDHNMYLYGGLFDGVAALANRLSPLGEYETRHLLNPLVGILGIVGCWLLGRSLAGPRAAFLAAALLFLTPSYYGHMFNNPKDIPFAVGVVWSLALGTRAMGWLPKVPWRLTLGLGIAMGMALGVRVGGFFLPIYLAVVGLLYLILLAIRERRFAWREARDTVVRFLLPAVAVAYGVMLLLWPWAQQDPFANPWRAITVFSDYPWGGPVLLAGRTVAADNLPWNYLFLYFGAKLPEVVLLGAVAATGLFGFASVEALRGRGRLDRYLPPALLACSIAAPFTYFLVLRPNAYDGIRQFLFLLPLLAAAAAVGFDAVWSWLGARSEFAARLLAVAIVCAGGFQIQRLAVLHPHQYVFYNALVGGTAGAQGRYELDYWGNSLSEAARALAAFVEAEGSPGPFRVQVCGNPISTTYFLPPGLELAREPRSADFFIAYTRFNCHKKLSGREIARIERAGALLSVVKDRRKVRPTS